MNLRPLLACLLALLSFGTLRAQQDAHYSHFMFNQLYFFPGYAGIEHGTRATFLHRSQWLGYDGTIDEGGAPSTQMLSVSHSMKSFTGNPVDNDYNSGIGLVFERDKLGPVRNLKGMLSYSYHFKFRQGDILGVGARAGFFNQSIDGSLLRAQDPNDPTVAAFGSSTNNQFQPDFALSTWYQRPKWFFGVTLNHLYRAKFQFGDDAVNTAIERHMNLTAGYLGRVGANIRVEPSAIFLTDFNQSVFNYGVVGTYETVKNDYWVGLTARQSIVEKDIQQGGKKFSNDDLTILIGISTLEQKRLRIGYAFDVVTSGVQAKNPTSHEIMISYLLPVGPEFRDPPLRTPRYRHEN